MELINLMHTGELIDIDNVGTVIMGEGVRGNFFLVSQYVCDIQPSTNIKGCRGELTAATIC